MKVAAAVSQILAADKFIGREWDGTNGNDFAKRKVGGKVNTSRGERYFIVTEGDRTQDLIPVDEIEKYIADDIRRAAANKAFDERNKKELADQEAKAAEKSSLDGFEKTLSPLMRGKAVKALTTKGISGNGKFYPSIRDFVRDLVKQGRKIAHTSYAGRVLEREDGAFISEKQITKLGMDYAAYLLEKHK